MNVELVAQMFKNYQSNVLFHLEGMPESWDARIKPVTDCSYSYRQSAGSIMKLPTWLDTVHSLSSTP